MNQPERFDGLGILATLERHRVNYVLIGALAAVLQGADEVTRGVDICPATKPQNLERLRAALEELGARPAAGRSRHVDYERLGDAMTHVRTPRGEIKVVPIPAGTRNGYDDLRRSASREALGGGLKPQVASLADITRMVAAVARPEDVERLEMLRELGELERSIGLDL